MDDLFYGTHGDFLYINDSNHKVKHEKKIFTNLSKCP